MDKEMETNYRIIRDEVRFLPQFADYDVSEEEIDRIAEEVARDFADKLEESSNKWGPFETLESRPYKFRDKTCDEEREVTINMDSTREEIFYLRDACTAEERMPRDLEYTRRAGYEPAGE